MSETFRKCPMVSVVVAAMLLATSLSPSVAVRAQSGELPTGAHPHGTRTGIPIIDGILGAVEAGEGLFSYLQFTDSACTYQQEEFEPTCPQGVEEGTLVPTVFWGGCQRPGIAEGDPMIHEVFDRYGPSYYFYGLAGRTPPSDSADALGAYYNLYLIHGNGVFEWSHFSVRETGITSVGVCNPLAEMFANEIDVIIAPVAAPGPPNAGSGLAPPAKTGIPVGFVVNTVAVMALLVLLAAPLFRRPQ